MDFLLVIRKDRSIAELRLDPATKKVLTQRFNEMADVLRNPDLERHPYEPAFTPDSDGVLELKPYQLPDSLWNCRTALPNLPLITEKDLTGKPPAAIVAVTTGSKPVYAFQAVGSRSIVQEKSSILFNPKGFKLNTEAGIAIGRRLDALHEGTGLLFRNEQTVRSFLPMDEHFTEATDEDIDLFFDSKMFVINDTNAVRVAATQVQRRKLHRLLKAGVSLPANDIDQIAQRVGVSITIVAGKVVVPTGKKGFADLVRIIHDDFLQSLHDSDAVYLVPSKRPIPKPAPKRAAPKSLRSVKHTGSSGKR